MTDCVSRQPAIWLILALPVVVALLASSVYAAESAADWQPPPPMPDEFDWVQLTSGEWLKGEIIAMYEEKLEFDSDKLDLQSIKWKDIKQLRSAGRMRVAFEDGDIERGQILVDGQTIRFLGDEERQMPRSEILSIITGAPREIENWTVKASLGANLRKGNSEQTEATTRVVIIRRSAVNRVNFDYLASFNQTEGIKTADDQRLTMGWNRYVSRKTFWTPLFGEWYRDPFSNIGNKWSLGAGLGYELVDTPQITWKIEGGLSYQETQFDSVADGEPTTASTPGLVFSTTYDHELTGWLDFNFDWRFNFVNEESGTYTHHLVTGLEFELTKILDLDITLIWDRIENPQEDADGLVPLQDDYRLVTSIGFEF
ncbi:MAG: DUF481 domain-containing protein [bacterium]|nr:DUF481 domain-containing protein [bacterium]